MLPGLRIFAAGARLNRRSGLDREPGRHDDPTRPVSTFELRPHFEDNSVTTPSDRYSLILRRNLTWDFSDGWRLGARGDLPLAVANTVRSITEPIRDRM